MSSENIKKKGWTRQICFDSVILNELAMPEAREDILEF